MANLIYVCEREATTVLDRRILERVAERITPDSIRGHPHRVLERRGEGLCLTGPHGAAGVSGFSAHLGAFSGHWKDWHHPGTPVPDGSFALIRSDGEVTELCADDVGSRTIWYAFTQRRFIASTSQRALVCLLGDLSLSRPAFAWFLSAGNLGPTDSWDLRIRRLPRGAKLILDRFQWRIQLHTAPVAFEARPMSEAEAREGLRHALWQAIQGCGFRTPPWILPLSGGYDSRLLLASLHEAGHRPRTVTWGMARSRTQRGNDAHVARDLARHYGLANDYLVTELSEAAPEAVVDAFLAAHGGTTDALFPYLDGLRMWSRFSAEGVEGIIRGDEGFGTQPRPEGHHPPAQGLILLQDFLDQETAGHISDGGQGMPEELLRRAGESLQAYGDRLVHSHFIPVTLAGLTDVKAPFLEIANPMLAGSVLAFVRQMPDAMRAGRAVYQRLTASVGPPVPFARLSADDNWNGFLYSESYTRWMSEELQGGFGDRHLPPRFRESLLAALGAGASSQGQTHAGKRFLKRVIPKSWVALARSLARPEPPQARELAFRCALASRLARLLQQDGQILAGAPQPVYPAISPMVIGTTP
jgi:hypothetical protein